MAINLSSAYAATQRRLQPNRPHYNARVEGEDLSKLGGDLTAQGLDSTLSQASEYAGMLRSGSVLPSSVTSALKRARGLVADRNVRDIGATKSRLAQARVASGGRLSQEAAQEYLTESESEANKAAYESDVNLSMQEADLELQETNTLRDRLQQAYSLAVDVGQNERKLSSALRLGSLEGRKHNGQQTASILSFLGSILGR